MRFSTLCLKEMLKDFEVECSLSFLLDSVREDLGLFHWNEHRGQHHHGTQARQLHGFSELASSQGSPLENLEFL